MTDESFDRKLLGMIAGTLRFHATLTAAQHMFGRSYFSLHSAEKAIVDKAVSAHSNYEVTDEVTDSVSLSKSADVRNGLRFGRIKPHFRQRQERAY